MSSRFGFHWLLCAAVLNACIDGTAAPARDGSCPPAVVPDGGMDAGTEPDAGAPDAGAPDAGPPDAGAPDAGVPDAGPPDAGAPDAGPPDAGPPAPADTLFAVGITDNSAGSPQAAPQIALKFHGGVPGPKTVVAKRVSTPITLDGNSADWVGVPESVVTLMTRGGAIGMTEAEWQAEYQLYQGKPQTYDFGIYAISVRVAYDDQRIYFLLQWADATQNRDRDTWFFDGGLFMHSKEADDHAYIGFDIAASTPAFEALGCAGACHVRERLGDVSDAGKAYRFKMHTNAPGEMMDYWAWRAASTDPMGAADDGYIDEVSRHGDGPLDWVVQNSAINDAGISQPQLMSPAGVNANPVALFKGDAGTPAGVTYDPTGAVDGSRIPGWLMQHASPGRDDVSAVGRYAGGYWTVEFSRALTTSDTKDVQFPLQ